MTMPTLCVRFVIAEGMPMARMLPTSRAVTARRRRARSMTVRGSMDRLLL